MGDREDYRSRDRDFEGGYRRRRSRSPDRRSRSRSRSPDRRRERRRQRVSGFDQGPPSFPNGGGRSPPPPGPYDGMRGDQMGGRGFPSSSGGLGNPNPYQPSGNRQGMQDRQTTRHARRVYVGSLADGLNDDMIRKFFGQALLAIGGTRQTGDPVLSVYFNAERKFSFVEFRTVEETSNAMALDGVYFEGSNVRVKRPNDYNPAMAASMGPSNPSPDLKLEVVGLKPGGYVSPNDSPDRIFIGGLPYYLEEGQIRELLGQFGAVRAFDLVKDKETGNSKGYGFAVYEDPSVTDAACAGLNGLRMGDKNLTVRRASEGARAQQQQQAQQALVQASLAVMQRQTMAAMSEATTVVKLSNCVTTPELEDPEEYEEILADMQDEAEKFGTVLKLLIPRPSKTEPIKGVGKVFFKFAQTSEAAKAFQAMNGRKFGGNVVKAEYLQEDKFDRGDIE